MTHQRPQLQYALDRKPHLTTAHYLLQDTQKGLVKVVLGSLSFVLRTFAPFGQNDYNPKHKVHSWLGQAPVEFPQIFHRSPFNHTPGNPNHKKITKSICNYHNTIKITIFESIMIKSKPKNMSTTIKPKIHLYYHNVNQLFPKRFEIYTPFHLKLLKFPNPKKTHIQYIIPNED